MEQFDKNDFKNFTLVGTPITAAPVDMSKYLEPGETDVGDKLWSEIFIQFTKKELKDLSVKFYTCGPITIYKRNIFDKGLCALEATTITFQNREDMLLWLKENSDHLIYQVIRNTVKDTFAVRFFQFESIDVRLNWFWYWYNRLFIWKNKV